VPGKAHIRLTVEQYRRRITESITRKDEAKRTVIPKIEVPHFKKKRGGKLAKDRRRLAQLLEILQAEDVPHWKTAAKLWAEYHTIDERVVSQNSLHDFGQKTIYLIVCLSHIAKPARLRS